MVQLIHNSGSHNINYFHQIFHLQNLESRPKAWRMDLCISEWNVLPEYCSILRDLACSLPLLTFWLFSPIYISIIRKVTIKLERPESFSIHLIFHTLIICLVGLYDTSSEYHELLHVIRIFRFLSYLLGFFWFWQLSTRLRSVHSSFIITFIFLTLLKLTDLIVLAAENTINATLFIQFLVLMAETALLANSKRQSNADKDYQTPEEKASFASKAFFSWLSDLVDIGKNRPLDFGDLYQLNSDAKSEYLNRRWNEEWEIEQRKNEGTEKESSLVWPFYRIQKNYIISVTCARFFSDILNYTNPILLWLLIDYIELDNQPLSFGLGVIFIMFIANVTRSLLLNYQIGGMLRMSIYYQAIMKNAILQKILKLSTRKDSGQVLNHANVDVESIANAFVYLQNTWSVPFQVIMAMIMLYFVLGWPALAGVCIMLLFIPLNYYTSKFIKQSQQAQMKIKDQRTKLSNELFTGIKVVKLYAWEKSFEEKINKLRAEEVDSLRKVCILSRIVDLANATSPFLVAVASFTCYVFFGEGGTSLTPSVAFVALTIFNQLRQPMRMVANLITFGVQAKVSNNRLRVFMNSKEMEKKVQVVSDDNAIVFDNASLKWDGPENPQLLKNISATVKTGELIAIVGSITGGKSSFLSAILDEMILLEGSIKVGGSLAYVPQKPWIFNKSVKDNILFGKEYDENRYEEVYSCCQLRRDFENDERLVGENGVNISGGQNARISLARSVYQEKEIYLLDDPLSAVDAHVGRALFDKVIGRNGLLKDKTRVLVTHNLQYTKYVDTIIVIKDGKIVEHGKFDDLVATIDGSFRNLWEVERSQIKNDRNPDLDESPDDEEQEEKKNQGLLKNGNGNMNGNQESVVKAKAQAKKDNKQETVQLGRVKKGIYILFFKAVGLFNCVGVLACFVLHFVMMGIRSKSLADWSDKNKFARHEEIDPKADLQRYAIFGLMEVAFLGAGFTLLTIGSLRASKGLHSPLIHSLLRAPITFFNDTPIGNIINRLSRDLDAIDRLQDSFRMILQSFLNSLMIVVLIAISTMYSWVLLACLSVSYYRIMIRFIPTARQLRRLESAHRSPILSKISETIHGASSIRVFDKTEDTINEFAAKIDKSVQCRYLKDMATQWLSTRLEFVGNVLLLCASLSVLVATRKGELSPGMFGLSISYALIITEILNSCVRLTSDIESNIVSVERVHEYYGIQQEAAWESEEVLPETWPSHGKIEFREYSMRYRKDKPLALDKISLEIDGREKIGLIGRTGSGKSSLTMALFRMLEADNGQILIDGRDISSIGLHQLRSNIIMIPQDPVVFAGTLRFNIDPFNRYSDDQILKCLEDCHMDQFTNRVDEQLNQRIDEGGSNMSMGERQLLCLCRAFLRNSKIVVLDEASASVDSATDEKIQNAIRKRFPDATTISIAHRLKTVEDSNKIVVLDAGQLKEFDTPSNLLENPDSAYSQLLRENRERKSASQ